jgi:hypothetical protein
MKFNSQQDQIRGDFEQGSDLHVVRLDPPPAPSAAPGPDITLPHEKPVVELAAEVRGVDGDPTARRSAEQTGTCPVLPGRF